MNANEHMESEKKKIIMISAELFLQNIARRFSAAIKKHPSGFTFNIINLRLKTNFSSKIYLVGQQEHSKSFEADPKFNELIAWLCNNLFAIYLNGGLIGGWWDKDGIFFLDVVAAIPGYENAMLSGMVNGEKEIYHPYSNRSIKVGMPQIEKYLSKDL